MLKNSRFSKKICFYETKFPISEKFANFHVMLDILLVSIVISYSQSEVIVFKFYQVLKNAGRSEYSELSRRISRILIVFSKIIVYLHKIIVDIKNMNCRKSSYSGNWSRKLQILLIFAEITAYLHKKKSLFKNYQS